MSVRFDRFISKLWPKQIALNQSHYSPDQIIEVFSALITPERLQKIDEVIQKRSQTFIPVLENIYDRGNISAVMRSAEAFGFYEMHIIESGEKFKESARVTQGADKWLNIYKWKSTEECLSYLNDKKIKIYATHLSKDSIEIKDIKTKPESSVALIFGNEKDGVSNRALEFCDGNVLIPMLGFTQSFNISVAAALCLQEAAKKSFTTSEQNQLALKATYILKSIDLTDIHMDKILKSKI